MNKMSKLLVLFSLSVILFSCNNDDSLYEIEPTIQYTLTYDANGATSGNAPESIAADAGRRITLDSGAELTRTDHTFEGWNTASDGTGTNYAAGSNYTLNSNITLYAKWGEIQSSSNNMKITVGTSIFTSTLISNNTVTEFKKMLPMTINMNDVNNNEKYYNLPNSLPTSPQHYSTINNGDIMLWGSNGLVLFYETFFSGYSYTPLGRVNNPSGLKNALNGNNIMVTLELEQ